MNFVGAWKREEIGKVRGQVCKKLLGVAKRTTGLYGGNVTNQGGQEVNGHMAAR
jgi:hypothetical protein